MLDLAKAFVRDPKRLCVCVTHELPDVLWASLVENRIAEERGVGIGRGRRQCF